MTTSRIARTELTLDEARAIRACAERAFGPATDELRSGDDLKAIDPGTASDVRQAIAFLHALGNLLDTVGWLPDEAGYVAEGCDAALLACAEEAVDHLDWAISDGAWEVEEARRWAAMIDLYRRLAGEEKLPTDERARILLAGVYARVEVTA